MTSIAPLRVAGLIEFHVFETDPLMLLTYCMAPGYEERETTGFLDDYCGSPRQEGRASHTELGDVFGEWGAGVICWEECGQREAERGRERQREGERERALNWPTELRAI